MQREATFIIIFISGIELPVSRYTKLIVSNQFLR